MSEGVRCALSPFNRVPDGRSAYLQTHSRFSERYTHLSDRPISYIAFLYLHNVILYRHTHYIPLF